MDTFCDVLHETKQKMQTDSQECSVPTVNHLLKTLLLRFLKQNIATFVEEITGKNNRELLDGLLIHGKRKKKM